MDEHSVIVEPRTRCTGIPAPRKLRTKIGRGRLRNHRSRRGVAATLRILARRQSVAAGTAQHPDSSLEFDRRHCADHGAHVNQVPQAVSEFLAGRRFAVAGVSRSGKQPANAIFRKLRDCGFDVVPINPNADRLEGATCYPDLASVPGSVDGLMVVTHPAVAADLVRQAAARGTRQVWFHRSFGDGSVSETALQACADLGIRPIVGGCPLMYCQPVDLAHRCFRWWLGRQGRVPG